MHPVLRVVIENDYLREYYTSKIQEHNKHVLEDPYPNSGFDLCVPDDVSILPGPKSTKVDLGIKCSMLEEMNQPTAFYTYPRSSMSKTPLILANHVGIIDSGYRGNLIAMFRNVDTEPFFMAKETRMIQICHPTLKPFLVELMVSVDDLGTTSRGTGGFGSTGL